MNPFNHLELTKDCIEECSASGPVDKSVEYWVIELKLVDELEDQRNDAIKYLEGFGCWDIKELGTMSDLELALKCLWIECGDRRDGL